MKKTLQVIATLVAKVGAADDLRDALTPVVSMFRAEPGCEAYVLLEDRKYPGRFMTYETWSDEAALAKHMTSPTMKGLEPVMKELLGEPMTQDFLSVVVAC